MINEKMTHNKIYIVKIKVSYDYAFLAFKYNYHTEFHPDNQFVLWYISRNPTLFCFSLSEAIIKAYNLTELNSKFSIMSYDLSSIDLSDYNCTLLNGNLIFKKYYESPLTDESLFWHWWLN